MSQGGRQDPGYGNGYGDDYAEDDDDFYTYDASEEEDEGRRRPLYMFAIFVLIFLFAGLVFLAYKQGLKQGAEGQPPIIRADTSPIKGTPVNPGGMEIPHQDRSVYDQMSGSGESDATDDTEHLLPKAEEPMAMASPEPPAEPAPVQAAPVAPVEQAAPVIDAPVAAAQPVEEAPAPAAPATTAVSGGFVVQLAAFRDEPAALTAFKKLQKKYPSLAALAADVQKADLGAKGIYYRLRAGFLDKPSATALCADLSGKGQACFVRPK